LLWDISKASFECYDLFIEGKKISKIAPKLQRGKEIKTIDLRGNKGTGTSFHVWIETYLSPCFCPCFCYYGTLTPCHFKRRAVLGMNNKRAFCGR